MDKDILQRLLDDDDLGLLTLKPKNTRASGDERLLSSFAEINDFVRLKGREPQANKSDIREMQLYSRLTGLREDALKSDLLRPYDEFSLLGETKVIKSISDIFEDDELGILDDGAEEIFVLKNVPSSKEISNLPDYIAQRKPCKDFARFEHLFEQCQSDLSKGRRTLSTFSRGSFINKGDFFVLKGVLVYVADEGERHPTADRNTFNARLRCIFENGTESNMLLRSLAAALYKEDGRRVSANTETLFQQINEISDEDVASGFIYVLASLSESPEIKGLKNLFKIGFARGSVEDRIKNAEREPTYLMAPVRIVTVFQCYNLNPQKFEKLIHHFFGSACLVLDVFDSDGKRYIPREWFVAPLTVITDAVKLLISGDIVNYRYDKEHGEIVQR